MALFLWKRTEDVFTVGDGFPVPPFARCFRDGKAVSYERF